MPKIKFYPINNNYISDENCGMCQDHLKSKGTVLGHTITIENVKTYYNMHQFHKECLKTWLESINSCPMCSSEGHASVDLSSILSRKERVIQEIKATTADAQYSIRSISQLIVLPQLLGMAPILGSLVLLHQIGNLTVSGNPLLAGLSGSLLRMVADLMNNGIFNLEVVSKPEAYLEYGLVAGLTGVVSLLANVSKDVIGANDTIIAAAATGAVSAFIASRAKIGATIGTGLMGLWLATAMIAPRANIHRLEENILMAATGLAATVSAGWISERYEDSKGLEALQLFIEANLFGSILTTALQIPYQWPKLEDAVSGMIASSITYGAYAVMGNEKLGVVASTIAGLAIGVISQNKNLNLEIIANSQMYTISSLLLPVAIYAIIYDVGKLCYKFLKRRF